MTSWAIATIAWFCFVPTTTLEPCDVFVPEESRNIPVFHAAGLLHPAPVHLSRDLTGGTPDTAQLCDERGCVSRVVP